MQTDSAFRRWAERPELQNWLDNPRLNLAGHWAHKPPSDLAEHAPTLRQRRAAVERLNAKLEALLRLDPSRGALGTPHGYSTVTDFARFRGWSTSVPFSTAT